MVPRRSGRRGAGLDAADLIPYLAGQVGQASLARLDGSAHPELDQHVAAVADAVSAELGERCNDYLQLLGFLVNYASGFVAAASGEGWQPMPDHQPLDWESTRLAAVCHLVRQLTDGPAASRASDGG
jgi:Family of unknown function (DUF6401)